MVKRRVLLQPLSCAYDAARNMLIRIKRPQTPDGTCNGQEACILPCPCEPVALSIYQDAKSTPITLFPLTTTRMLLPFESVTVLLTLGLSVSAHKEPKTEKEIEVQRALQAAAYHVRLPSASRTIS